jgi:biotin operon repressor
MFIHVKSSGYQIFIQVGKGYGIIRPMRAQGDTLC